MIFNKFKNKKGFSLVEVAIAMAVVSIVTITAIAIIYPATEKTKEANAKSNAIYCVADVIECYKVMGINVLDQFPSAREGVAENRTKNVTLHDDGTISYNDDCTKEYIIAGNCCIHLKFVGNDMRTLQIWATDSRGNNILDRNVFPYGYVEFEKSPR